MGHAAEESDTYMHCDLEYLSRVFIEDQIHTNTFNHIRSSTRPFSEWSLSYLLTSIMTVSTPSFVFPHNFDSSAAGNCDDPPFNSSSQWQYGTHADRPCSDTGSTAYGTYVC